MNDHKRPRLAALDQQMAENDSLRRQLGKWQLDFENSAIECVRLQALVVAQGKVVEASLQYARLHPCTHADSWECAPYMWAMGTRPMTAVTAPRPGYCQGCGPVDLVIVGRSVDRCANCKAPAIACDTPLATPLELVAFVPRVAITQDYPQGGPPTQHPPCRTCGATESLHKFYPGARLCNACYQRRRKDAQRRRRR